MHPHKLNSTKSIVEPCSCSFEWWQTKTGENECRNFASEWVWMSIDGLKTRCLKKWKEKCLCRISTMASKKSGQTRSAVLALAPIQSGQRCDSHLPSTRAVRGVALNGWPDFIMPQSNPSKPPLHRLTPNLLSISHSICCSLDRYPWVLRWSLIVSLSGEDFKMPENRNRALFVEIANIEYWVPIPDFLAFRTGATCDSFVLK